MSAHVGASRPLTVRTLTALVAAGLLLLGLAACGDDDGDVSAGSDGTTSTGAPGGDGYGGTTGGTTGGTAEATTVVAKDFSLTSLTVAPGAEVTFENKGERPHTMTADDGAFDSQQTAPGATATVVAPTEPGAYPFHCEIHSSMTATLTVEG